MVIAGFVIPSPGLSTPDPEYGDSSEYRPLAAPSNPELLIVPAIKLRAPIIPISMVLEGGVNVLHPPEDYREVGWWKSSAKPGSPSGQTLLTGHTVHTGGGVMNKLGELRPGAAVQIKTKRGTVEYLTTKVFVYTRAQLAKHSEELFSQDRPDNRLVLVTCTGWTGSEYTSNIIVFATPLGVRKNDDEPR
ncbi:class F sortase [Nocardioides marmoriginsengisoli]|uniref:Class F sortase n=2 Tax=Nocardioides marmoriginsengisoli TaxID=661483 RepID=A0A3N0CIC4_9ACTN|nr:class F sortase [Nocardioides marmoriginsengisoli]